MGSGACLRTAVQQACTECDCFERFPSAQCLIALTFLLCFVQVKGGELLSYSTKVSVDLEDV